jgi:hypothetical protein
MMIGNRSTRPKTMLLSSKKNANGGALIML